jgi:hypothetical protein
MLLDLPSRFNLQLSSSPEKLVLLSIDTEREGHGKRQSLDILL